MQFQTLTQTLTLTQSHRPRKTRAASAVARALFATLVLVSSGQAAHAQSNPSALPASATAFPEPATSLVWVGRGEASVLTPAGWQRTPGSDYDFSVVQRRYADRWESIKEMHRRHPDYDGNAGPRDQTYYFRLDMGPVVADTLPVRVASTLGDGSGKTDREFRRGVLEFDARGVSRFAPFNRYRITQQYRYEDGLLLETVELFKRASDGTEKPFVKIEERAELFAKRRFDAAPTLAN